MSSAKDFTIAPQAELQPWAEQALKEQEAAPPASEQRAQDPAANDVLLFQLPMLAAGDAEGLADLLERHPDLHEQILQAAAGFLGNDTVVRALDVLKRRAAQPHEEPKEELTPPAVVAEQAAEATPAGTTESAPAPAPTEQAEDKVEPGWVVRARAYNANHPDEVWMFNMATGFACRGADGAPDPNAVANWQHNHGLKPDGRIGKQTAERAWTLMPVEKAPEPEAAPAEAPPPA
ncbi:MAG: hypothetical protein HS111_33675 [Kofleriaceae bacterium]|nr:hypothetical protein [Kofleriaceae bacterium]MCL4226016.1 hypothetical protein [Myxococcales bacterium]